jgi:predicted transcriptional regulator
LIASAVPGLMSIWDPASRMAVRSLLAAGLPILFLGTTQVGKRDRIQILAELIASADGATAKTRMMYKSNLDTRALKKYLQYLMDKGFLVLVVNENDRHCYQPTEKGRQFLHDYRRVELQLA